MKITNTTSRDLGLTPETVIPAGQSVDVAPEIAASAEKSPVVQGWMKSGALVVETAKQATPKKTAKAEKKPETDKVKKDG